MPKVYDVAAYILARRGPMTAMKLQKLVYYSQAWSLVWDERPLFEARVEAWANGPVVRDLYDAHRGMFTVRDGDITGDESQLDQDARDTIDAVLETYGPKTAHWLSELTHREPPWRDAREREGLTELDRGNAEITHQEMHEYYDSLTSA